MNREPGIRFLSRSSSKAQDMVFSADSRKRVLENIYSAYHKADYIHPDPLEFLHRYSLVQDREIVGLFASSFAYGRVGQILRSVTRVLDAMDGSPCLFVMNASREDLREKFCGFKHRFTTAEELVELLHAAGKVISAHGSLYECFLRGYDPGKSDVSDALMAFTVRLREYMGHSGNSLLPCPERQSACKRLHLFLRWMVRKDEVDPGGWEEISPSRLIVPLDVHMHRIGMALGMTRRAQADLRTALEITGAFRKIAPDDPVRYDFSLTRMGIRNDIDKNVIMNYREWLRKPKNITRGACYG